MKQTMIRIVAFAALAVMLFGMVSCEFSYIKDDISEYVSLDKAKLDALRVTIPTMFEVTEEDVDELIRQNLFTKKTAANGGREETSGTVGDGDNVRLWYSGVVEVEEGKTETIRDAASDRTYSNTPLWSVIGAESLRIKELEERLKEVKIEDYITYSKGTVKADAIYFLSYYYNDLDANGKSVGGAKFDGVNRVPASEMHAKFDAGFKEAFDAAVVGQTFDVEKSKFFKVSVEGTFPNGGVTREYSIRVCGQSDRDLEIEGAFADDGGTYAGKKVKLFVQPFCFVDYDVPELTAETAVSLFKIDKDNPDPVAEFRRQAREVLENDSERQSALQDAVWVELKNCVTIHDLPKSKVKKMYKVFLDTVKSYYKEAKADDLRDQFVETYGEAAMESIDTFAVAMLKGNAGETAKQVVMRKAEDWVREDLLVFVMVREAGLALPSEHEINAQVNEDIANIISETGSTEEQLYDSYGGREYFVASCYRREVLELLAKTVDVEYKDITE